MDKLALLDNLLGCGLLVKHVQGIQKLHPNSRLTKKKPKGGHFSPQDRAYNRELAQERVVIEPLNRRLKIFKILSQRHCNSRHRFWVAVQSHCHFVQL